MKQTMAKAKNCCQGREREDRPVLGDHEDGDEVDDGQGQELLLGQRERERQTCTWRP